jgi:hypothetical protein
MIEFLRQKAAPLNDAGEVDWPRALILFFRVMAAVQFVKGLVHWGLLLGDAGGEGVGADLEYQAANIYFAVLDPIASVGLWMTSSWGAILWLLAAVSQIAACAAFNEVYGTLWPLLVFELMSVGVYVYITWQVSKVSDD